MRVVFTLFFVHFRLEAALLLGERLYVEKNIDEVTFSNLGVGGSPIVTHTHTQHGRKSESVCERERRRMTEPFAPLSITLTKPYILFERSRMAANVLTLLPGHQHHALHRTPAVGRDVSYCSSAFLSLISTVLSLATTTVTTCIPRLSLKYFRPSICTSVANGVSS